MIRFGKLTDYAMLIMSHMAKEPHSILSATSLAEVASLSTPTVSKVLKMLAEAGLVSSIRGADGGYRLTRPAQAISLVDVIAAMEGEFAMTECCEKLDTCVINGKCLLRENWRKINSTIQSFLAELTILDMLEPLSLPNSLQRLTHGK